MPELLDFRSERHPDFHKVFALVATDDDPEGTWYFTLLHVQKDVEEFRAGFDSAFVLAGEWAKLRPDRPLPPEGIET